jgi:hypothetical protein
MQFNDLARWVAASVVSAALAGCAREQNAAAGEAAADPPETIPLALNGQSTTLHLSFPQHDQRIDPGQFNQDEICYLSVGDFRVDCYTDGSSLNLGPNDSTDLLTDNPMASLTPVRDDKDVVRTMKLYGILFLVGGSIDRLPGTLADYIGNPNQHLNEAVALAQLLLSDKKVEFEGHARGGNFAVAVELNDDGRDKLLDALDEMGQSGSSTQRVRLRAATTGRRHAPSHGPAEIRTNNKRS